MKFVSRQQCGLKAPRPGIGSLVPSFGSTVHYEAAASAADHARCDSIVRGIQAFHMGSDRGWLDIAYTSLGCQHGYVYEGRWVGKRTAAQGTDEGNATAYAHCLMIGVGETPSQAMLDATVDVLALLRWSGKAGQGVNGHRDWHATACPGDPTYALLPTIRQRLSGAGTGPANPLPPVQAGPIYQEDHVQPHALVIATDGQGRGYRDINVPFGPGVVTINGDDPGDGWGGLVTAPPFHINHGGLTRVVIPESTIKSGQIAVTFLSFQPA